MSIDTMPWYKKYWKLLLAGLGLVLTGLMVVASGRTGAARKNVNKLNQTINDIDAKQTLLELEEHKIKYADIKNEKNKLEKEQALIRQKMRSSPQFDPNKTDAENLDTLRKVTW